MLAWFIKVSQSIHVPVIEVTKRKEPNRADIKTERQTAGWSLRFGLLGFILGGELILFCFFNLGLCEGATS